MAHNSELTDPKLAFASLKPAPAHGTTAFVVWDYFGLIPDLIALVKDECMIILAYHSNTADTPAAGAKGMQDAATAWFYLVFHRHGPIYSHSTRPGRHLHAPSWRHAGPTATIAGHMRSPHSAHRKTDVPGLR